MRALEVVTDERDAARAEAERLRGALEEITASHAGSDTSGNFDRREIARAALSPATKGARYVSIDEALANDPEYAKGDPAPPEEPVCNGSLVHHEHTPCPKCDR